MSILVKVESEIKDELRILNQYESVEEPNSVLICRKVKGKYRFSLRRKGEKKQKYVPIREYQKLENIYRAQLISEIRKAIQGNVKALRSLLENLADYESGEMIAYGRIPLMLTAQCQQKNTYGCTHRPGWLYLEDRMHKHFPVRNVCSSCYNIIYNSVPLFLTEAAGNNTGQKPGSFRLQLTEETAEQSADILQVFERVLAGGVIRPEDLPEHTKGHYKRGVE